MSTAGASFMVWWFWWLINFPESLQAPVPVGCVVCFSAVVGVLERFLSGWGLSWRACGNQDSCLLLLPFEVSCSCSQVFVWVTSECLSCIRVWQWFVPSGMMFARGTAVWVVWLLLPLLHTLGRLRGEHQWLLGCWENTGSALKDPQPRGCACSAMPKPFRRHRQRGWGLFLPTKPPGRGAAQFFHILDNAEAVDKQDWSCRMITLFGKNRAALALQRKGSVTWCGEGSGLLLPSEECIFGEPYPVLVPGRQLESEASLSAVSCWLMQCPELLYLPNPWAACPALGFSCLPFPHCPVEWWGVLWGWEPHGCVLISSWVFPSSASYHCWELKLSFCGQGRVCPEPTSLLASLQFHGGCTSSEGRACKIGITDFSYIL